MGLSWGLALVKGKGLFKGSFVGHFRFNGLYIGLQDQGGSALVFHTVLESHA